MNIPDTVNEFADSVHKLAVEKGWWPANGRNDGELIALIHSELSELLESIREGTADLPCEKVPTITCAEEECADVIIRILDMAQARGWNVGRALAEKHMYNQTREHRHGGKRFRRRAEMQIGDKVRIVRMDGCMAHVRGDVREGEVEGFIKKKVYGAASEQTYVQVRFGDGTTDEYPADSSLWVAYEGAVEYRDA